jgi:signal transduction histidine kinase
MSDTTHIPLHTPESDARNKELQILTENLQQEISIRESIETRLAESLVRESQFSDMRSKFVTMLSHQLRTPLTMIKSGSDLIEYLVTRSKKEADVDINSPDILVLHKDKLYRQISSIDHGIQQILGLLDSISQLTDTQTRALQSSVGLCSLTKEIDKALTNVASDPQVRLLCDDIVSRIRIDDRGIVEHILAKTYALNVILTEIIKNAIIFSSLKPQFAQSPITITLDPVLIQDIRSIRITVTNEGSYVPAGEERNIFEYFYTAGEAAAVGRHRGLGIGLGSAQFCAQTMDASIYCEPGHIDKAVFMIELPI